MTGQTKMIIITSNEDIIRQFSFNKTTNTHIIDLDNNKQMVPIEKDSNNSVNLAFFAGLSELNSSNDQIYKRALDSSDHKPSKPIKTPKKSVNLICTICGDQAIGYNYDALSCASCKAFFRRNANQPPDKIKCITGRGQCSVTHGTYRKCPKCRLERCLAMGMRKDFILSEEEKQRRKERLEENRSMTSQRLLSAPESTNLSSTSQTVSTVGSVSPKSDEIDRLLMNTNQDNDNNVLHESNDSYEMEEILFDTLSVEDWITTQSVRSLFLSMFPNDHVRCPFDNKVDRVSTFISWSERANQLALRFISFFRQIGEFEGLHNDDRFILIKYNLLPLFPIIRSYNFKSTGDCWSRGDNEDAARHRQFFTLCHPSTNIREKFVTLMHSLVEVTEQDPTILSLLLVILLFSQGLSMSEDEPSLKDPLGVSRVQAHYTQILWNYMVNEKGEMEAWRRFTKLLTGIFRIQSAVMYMRNFLRAQFLSSNTVDRIAPLMQTVLQIY